MKRSSKAPTKKSASKTASKATSSLKATAKPSTKAKPSKPEKQKLPDAAQLDGDGAVAKVLESIRSTMSVVRTNYHAALRVELARAYAVARHLKGDPDAWEAFCEDDCWESAQRRPADRDRADALRFVLYRVVSGSNSSKSKRVSKYCAALKPFLEEDISPRRIPGIIKERGGIEALARAHSGLRIADSSASDTEMASPRSAETESAGPKPLLVVGMSDDLLLKTLSLEDGQSAQLSIKAFGPKGAWRVIEGVHLRRK